MQNYISLEFSEEAEYYKTLGKLFKTPHEIMEVLKMLIFWKNTPKAPIYDGDTKKMVSNIHLA